MGKEDFHEDYSLYQQRVTQEIKKEIENNDEVKRRCKFVSFISTSAGKDRLGKKRKRKERLVELLVVDGNYAHCVKDNEIKPRQKKDHIAIDILANEILADLPQSERTVEMLLKRIQS